MRELADKQLLQRVWAEIYTEAEREAQLEPMLASFYHSTILNHNSFAEALAFHLSAKLGSDAVPAMIISQEFILAMSSHPEIVRHACLDLEACYERDPACDKYAMPFLYFKGFHALQAYRITHSLWQQRRYSLALYLQNKISTVLDVDIHPAASLGHGIMIDHATGVVIGETCKIGNNVSLLHSVTLGGCGSEPGSRHPKVGDGVLISAGAKLLGGIEVGEGAKIAAGSLVLEDVAPHTTVAGVPSRVIGRPKEQQPALNMNQQIK